MPSPDLLEKRCENAVIVQRDLGLYKCSKPEECANKIQPFTTPEYYCKALIARQYEHVKSVCN